MLDQKKSQEIIDLPEMVEYVLPSLETTKTSIEPSNLRTHRSPNWDGSTGITILLNFLKLIVYLNT